MNPDKRFEELEAKPIGEWTLKEAKEYCESFGDRQDCYEPCVLSRWCDHNAAICSVAPVDWELD